MNKYGHEIKELNISEECLAMCRMLAPEKREELYKSILKDLLLPENSLWLETLDTFFRLDRSTINTADQLYIHRNTLLFRLRKIEKITGFNPQSFNDSVILYMGLVFRKLDGRNL